MRTHTRKHACMRHARTQAQKELCAINGMLKRKMANLKTQSKQFEATKRIWMRDAQDTIRRVEESLHCMCPWKFNMMLHAWIWLKPEFPMMHYRMFSTWGFTRTRTPIITDKFDAKVKNLQYAVASAAKYVNVAKVRVNFEARSRIYYFILYYIVLYI